MEEISLPAVGQARPPSYDPTFVGRGFYWPMQVDHTGSIRMTDGVDDLDRSMTVVLSTAPGERVMRPQFGCRIWDLVFEPVTANLLGLMSEAVRQALAQWEPRVAVQAVRAEPHPDDTALVMITVQYLIKSTNDRRNLVYPFYVIPHEEN